MENTNLQKKITAAGRYHNPSGCKHLFRPGKPLCMPPWLQPSQPAAAASSSKSVEVGHSIALWEVPDFTPKIPQNSGNVGVEPPAITKILIVCHRSIIFRHNSSRKHPEHRLEHHFFLTQLCAHPDKFPLGSSSKDQSTLGLVALKNLAPIEEGFIIFHYSAKLSPDT